MNLNKRNTKKDKLKENKKYPYKKGGENRTKKIIVIFFGLFISLFLINQVSALLSIGHYTNFKTTDDFGNRLKYGKITIGSHDFLFLGKGTPEATYTLLDNSVSVINGYAIGTARLYKDGVLFSGKKFKGGYVKDSHIYIWVKEPYTQVIPDYKSECKIDYSNSTSGNKICNEIKTGSHIETRYKAYWKEYNGEILKAGKYKWKLTGRRNINQKVDWILTSGIGNIDLNQWAWWNSSWNKRREISALTGNISYLNITYDSDMNADFSDLRFVDNATETTELNYTIENKTDSAWAIVRVNNLGASAVQMYYNNSNATTTSNASDTYYKSIGLYYLDESYGDAIDYIGTNDLTNGTVNISTHGVTGKIDTAYDFVRENSEYLKNLSLSYSVAYTDNHSVSVWVNPATISDTAGIIDWGSSASGDFLIRLYINGTSNVIASILDDAVSGSSINIADSSPLSSGSWAFLTLTYNGNTNETKFYVNGNLIGTKTSTADGLAGNHITVGTLIYEGSPSTQYFNGTIDEVGLYNKVLTPEEVQALYNQTSPNYVLGVEQSPLGVSTTLNSPIDAYNSASSSITFNWASVPFTTNLTNTTLYVWDGSGKLLSTTFYSLSGDKSITTTKTETLSDGSYIWNAETCGESNDCSFATSNRTLNIDTTNPSITLNYAPSGTFDYMYEDYSLTLNFTAVDNNLDTCWYEYNNTNTTVSCTNNTLVNVPFNYQKNENTITAYANDTFGNLGSSSSSWSYKIFYNSRTLNSSSYESAYETYKINLTSNSSLTSVYLNYSGNPYKTTYSGDEVWTYSWDLPFGTNDNNSVNWIMTYDGVNYSTDYSYQNVSRTVFTLCNSTYSNDALNITFKDEATLKYINASIPTSTFTYYLGTGTVKKTYTFSNTSNNNNYLFCSSTSRNLHVLPYIQYKQGTDYPQRIWQPSLQTYNQTAVEKVLYLLSSTNGMYVTYIVYDNGGNQIKDVNVNVKRTINGETFEVGNGQTDASGTITFWLYPDFLHTVTFTKTGYTTYILDQFPTQPTYVVILGQPSSSDVKDYIRGITYQFTPLFGTTLNSSELQTFNMTFNSSYWNVSSFGFTLYGDETTIGANSSTGNGGSIWNVLNVSNYTKIKVKIYWVINGTLTYGINNGWDVFNYEEGTGWSIKNLFKDISDYTTEGNGIFGMNKDSLNLILFLIIFMSVGIMSYKFGITSPASVSGMVFALVFLFDYGLGMISTPIVGGVNHLATIFTLLVTVAFVFWEVKR